MTNRRPAHLLARMGELGIWDTDNGPSKYARLSGIEIFRPETSDQSIKATKPEFESQLVWLAQAPRKRSPSCPAKFCNFLCPYLSSIYVAYVTLRKS